MTWPPSWRTWALTAAVSSLLEPLLMTPWLLPTPARAAEVGPNGTSILCAAVRAMKLTLCFS